MGKYEAAFAQLGERALATLEGPGGLLAITETHLVFLDEKGVRRLELARIRRVSRGEGNTLMVQADQGTLEIPLRAFPLEELKAFLEGLKPHVARARRATLAPPPTPKTPPPEQPPTPPQPPLWEEEAPPKRPPLEPAPEPEETLPPAPRETPPPTPQPRGGGSPLRLPLKLLSLLTLGYTVAFLALNPGTDPWALAGVVLGGLGLSLTEWFLATSSR